MKRTKITALLLVLVMLACSLSACTGNDTQETTTSETTTEPTSSEQSEKTNVNISVLKGPTGMGAAYLMNRNGAGLSYNNYNFSVESAPDAVVSSLLSGNTDIAAIPTTSAASLYNKTDGKIKILGISTLSVLYIVEKGNTITDMASLRGKTIVTSGRGTNVEYVMNYILKQNGLTPGVDVEVEFVSEHAEAVTKAKAGSAEIILIPEPFVTQITNSGDEFRIAFDFAELWEKASSLALPMGVIAVRTEFAEEHPQAVENFVSEYAASIEKANSEDTRYDVAGLIEYYGIMDKEVALAAIPNCNIVFINGESMKSIVNNFFDIMYGENPEIIGGSVPDDAIYYGP